jgi:hypothetical protein
LAKSTIDGQIEGFRSDCQKKNSLFQKNYISLSMSETKIPDVTIAAMREQLLGKRISVSGQLYQGKPIGDIVGKCEYFGYNQFLPSWGLQVTIDRMPISNVLLSQIKIVE